MTDDNKKPMFTHPLLSDQARHKSYSGKYFFILNLSRRLFWCFVFVSVVCSVAYTLIGFHVDADGVLKEPFFLIPLMWLAVVAALLCGLIWLAIRYAIKARGR